MKQLIIVRHAKTEVLQDGKTDFERNLKSRGINDSKLISEKLKEKEIIPDIIISSKANRALQTAEIFADVFGYDKNKIEEQNFLYDGFTTDDFISFLNNQNDSVNIIMVFGHSPSIEYLAFNLLDEFYEDVPTCAVIGIDFNVIQWKSVEARKGKRSLYEFPKKYK